MPQRLGGLAERVRPVDRRRQHAVGEELQQPPEVCGELGAVGLLGPPLPGHEAHAGAFAQAAQRAMAVLLDVLVALPAADDRPTAAVPGALAHHRAVLDSTGAGAAELELGVRIWSRLHGVIMLEIGGNFAAMGVDGDELFATEVAAVPV